MKNIVIIGAPRSGKSTFARKLFEKEKKYNVIGSDEVRDAFMEVIPELEINDKNGVGTKDIFPIFMNKFLELSSFNNMRGMYYIVEGYFSDFDQATHLFDRKNNILIFMGKAELSEEELFQNIRNHAYEKDDWTKSRTDEDLRRYCKNYLKMSKYNKEMCLENNEIFIDTSYNYNKVIDEYVIRILNGEFD
jgi:adenylate kinase family enzyme